ncbi:hypothetical protein OH77DRAFT_1514689 [Trametes cingulata]|nr:hypothetical protein OH77DRAFT_1514689 [Trametes cingulata]
MPASSFSSHRQSSSMPSSGVEGNPDPGGDRRRRPPGRSLQVLIDKVADALLLNDKYRVELHRFKTHLNYLTDLDSSFWRPTLIQQATLYKSLELQESILEAVSNTKAEVKEVRTEVGQHFMVDKETNQEIIAICKVLILESLREDYDFADEVLFPSSPLISKYQEKLKDTATYPRFATVWNSMLKSKIVGQVVCERATYACKLLRKTLVENLFGPRTCGLTICVRSTTKSFGWSGPIPPETVLHIAVLCQFMRDNRELLRLTKNDSMSRTTAGEDGQPGQKRKRAVGRSDTSFWVEFEDWLKEKNETWGRDIRGRDWNAHIKRCLARERRDFPEDKLSLISQRASSVHVKASSTVTDPPDFPGLASIDIDNDNVPLEEPTTPLFNSPLLPVVDNQEPDRVSHPSVPEPSSSTPVSGGQPLTPTSGPSFPVQPPSPRAVTANASRAATRVSGRRPTSALASTPSPAPALAPPC